MPVKKTPAAKKPRAKKNIKTDQKIAQDIKAAVEKIPGLIYEKVEFTEPTLSQIPAQKLQTRIPLDYETAHKKRFYVWLGVIGVMLIIIALWLLNTKIFFEISSDKNTNFIDDLKKSWQKMDEEKNTDLQKFFPTEQNTSTAAATTALKNSLMKILAQTPTSTTSTTSTLELNTESATTTSGTTNNKISL